MQRALRKIRHDSLHLVRSCLMTETKAGDAGRWGREPFRDGPPRDGPSGATIQTRLSGSGSQPVPATSRPAITARSLFGLLLTGRDGAACVAKRGQNVRLGDFAEVIFRRRRKPFSYVELKRFLERVGMGQEVSFIIHDRYVARFLAQLGL
jgi:hypothetical protein